MDTGDRIRHAEFGLGTVERLVGPHQLEVVFEGWYKLPIRVQRRECIVIERAPEKPRARRPETVPAEPVSPLVKERAIPKTTLRDLPRKSTAGTLDASMARKLLEALRLGSVPAEHVHLYTVGRDDEMSRLEKAFTNYPRKGQAFGILGDFGTGKTHLMEVATQSALSHGWVVTHTFLHPDEIPPSHPKRVYRALIRGLIYPEAHHVRGLGLEPLFERAFERGTIDEAFGRTRGQRDPSSYHALLTPALSYYRKLRNAPANDELIQELLDWIEGNTLSGQDHLKNKLRMAVGRLTHPIWALPDFRTYYHVYAYLLDGIAQLCRAAGYAGLVVMIDEAERYDLLSLQDQGFAVELMGALFSAASEELDRRPIRLGKGGHRAFQDLPPRFGKERSLCPIMAVTPGTEGEAVVKRLLKDAPYLLQLTPLTPKDFALLALKVIDIYAIAHPAFVPPGDERRRWALDLGERVRGLVEQDELRTPRDTLQMLVAVLDAARTKLPPVEPTQIRMTS